MQDGKPPTTPTSKATPSNSKSVSPTSGASANGGKQGGAGKTGAPGGRGGGGEGLASLAAKMMGAKGKKQGNTETSGVNETSRQRQNGCLDDLPLGSEAHSLSLDQANGIDSRNLAPSDKRPSLLKTASQGIMGWQSFNSDVSNQTSASSASLEMLLNERQVDPEAMLLNLGFGGEGQSYVPYLARVPQRFLHHPSRAYGIDLPDMADRVDGEAGDETVTGTPVGNSGSPSAAPPAKKRTGIWTLARTLSLMRMKPRNPLGHVSPSATPCGTPPLPHQPYSILHPSNQKYLASRGYYMQQGWPKGTFEEPEEDLDEIAEEEDEASKNAASKRRMFQKTRSRRNWSLCDSGDNENVPPSSGDMDWMTQSMDDSLSREDSLGRGHYFSTTTESSTDSLDTPNFETERAFEEIRRQYNESRKKERSSSEDLFMPRRKKRLSSEIEENDHNHEEEEDEDDHGLDLLSANDSGKNYFISPASSRQTTIEKAPTISEHYNNEDSEVDSPRRNDDNNNKTKDKGTNVDDGSLLKSKDFSNNEDSSVNTNSEVRIIVSSTDSHSAKDWSNPFRMKSPSKLTVEGTQRASSDSGSSSSGTAVGSNVATGTEDTDTPRMSESESVTDKDSISRTHSPYGFSHSPDRSRQMVTNSCQTSDTDFNLAAAAAANQSVNVTTITASNTGGSTKARRVGTSAMEEGQGEKGDDQGHKIQLSSLPSSINPLELMKRLRHSQDELSRMGSVQSDSSGFGDSDIIPAESGPQDNEQLKVASLGSSMESSTTLASSAATTILREPNRGEIGTQTSVDSSKSKSRATDEKSRHKESPRPTGEGTRYVTMCYIPSLMPKNDQDGLRQRSRGYSIDVAADLRHRPHDPNGANYYRVDGYNEIQQGHPTHGNSDYDLRRGGYGDSRYSSGRIISSSHSHHKSPGFERYRNQVNPHQNQANPHHSHSAVDNIPSSTPRVHSQKDFLVGDPNRRYTSQLDLYTDEAGLQKKEVWYYTQSPGGHSRRFSDDGILEHNSKINRRNDTPLSEELALAMGSGASSLKATTAQPVSITTSNIVSSKSVFVQSGPTVTATLPTPAKFKTEAGCHFPPLAGNLSGLRMEQHSTPINSARSPPKSRQRSCDILEDDFTDGDLIPTNPNTDHGHFHSATGSSYSDHPPTFRDSPTLPKRNIAPGGFSSWHEWAHHSPAQPYAHSLPPRSHSRTSDDLETYSSIAESSSDFSIQSTPEGHSKAGILDSRKLARLINQPIYFKGKRRSGSHYQPRRLFKEWTLLSKRKRLQEENRLLQYALQKYKTELSIMETSFIVDCQAVYSDLTDEERADIEELEWLWGEVRGQVLEMERNLLARVKSVHAGNDFHSLMSSMGVITKMIDVIKEQIYQQQVANNRAEDDEDDDDYDDDLEMYEDLHHERRRGSYHSSHSHSWMAGMGKGANARRNRHLHSSSTSNLPADLNISLEQMKSSLLSQVQSEIKESTKKLEMDLQEKDREIKQLREQLDSSTEAINRSPRRWTPKSTPSRSRSLAHGQKTSVRSRSRPRVVGDRIVHETDV